MDNFDYWSTRMGFWRSCMRHIEPSETGIPPKDYGIMISKKRKKKKGKKKAQS